ncbi:hypothetical protein C488_11277 [Natrinema pellirubrum DSM 15624]|uniref:Uncharacterized protein n=1 Tax=Natrinema pellirubrum (strain DSM 15624 / CIP 106293 / JCM 10476 / NCIMB 786 / 157) TaxID=797303 RepID=L0JLU5_NATP1|nr:hypothetical protein [Natrinema pellirubrum]AGB32249.1 hypothetical protein Natpe_2433 [Natrinema pellirubrum DSM 15624]ELY74682.1 hypothetical protein C488_11277 [Natrinema pellirubrum DSM 15624]
MKHTHRRELLVTTGTGIAALGAGCLGMDDDDEGTDDDADSPTEARDSSASTPLERWIPAGGTDPLLFHYRDLTALETYEDALQASVIESVPTLPDGDSAGIVEDAADGTDAVDAVLRFGSKGVVGNVVVSGSFDPDALETDGDASVGAFETLERDGVSVAVTEETLVVSPDDGADLESILAAGVEGTDRRVEASENVASLVERIADATFCWGQYAETEGTGRAFSWTIGSDTTTYQEVGVYADAEAADGFESRLANEGDVRAEVDDNVAVATGSFPTEEYSYLDLFAEQGSSPPETPQAGVAFDADYADRTVTVTYASKERAERLELSDDHGNSGEMTAAGETTAFEYESGASGELTVVGVWDGEKVVIGTYSYSF